MKILLYCNRPKDSTDADTITDHIDSFSNFSKNRITVWSSLAGLPNEELLNTFDSIIIHYSLSFLYDSFIPPESLSKLRKFKGLKILFIQDEYRRVDYICEKVKFAKIQAIFTCAPSAVAEKIYHKLVPNIQLITTLTGYVPEKLLKVKRKSISERNIHVGYRARRLPFWYGKKSYEKYEIGKRFLEHAKKRELTCDISSEEKDRIYGNRWINFISNCKATLGTESGASIIDFSGKIEYDLNCWQAFHPFSDFNDVPASLLVADGEIDLQVISPRCFEAAALGTVMILYRGEYSGILKPDRHYLALEKDFSNIDEIIRKIKDDQLLAETAQNTYSDLIQTGDFSYKTFIKKFDDEILELIKKNNYQNLGKVTELSESSFLFKKNVKPRRSRLKNLLFSCKRIIWRNLPQSLKLLLEVTVLRKKVYHHLFY